MKTFFRMSLSMKVNKSAVNFMTLCRGTLPHATCPNVTFRSKATSQVDPLRGGVQQQQQRQHHFTDAAAACRVENARKSGNPIDIVDGGGCGKSCVESNPAT